MVEVLAEPGIRADRAQGQGKVDVMPRCRMETEP